MHVFLDWLIFKGVFIRNGSFLSKSGDHFSYETDLRNAYDSFESANKTSQYIFEMLNVDQYKEEFFFLGVPETGSIIALFLNWFLYQNKKTDFYFNILRSVPKLYQESTRSIHTVLPSRNSKVIIVEDDVVSGNTLVNTIDTVKNLNFEIIDVVSIIDRGSTHNGMSVEDRVKKFGLSYRTLIDRQMINNVLGLQV